MPRGRGWGLRLAVFLLTLVASLALGRPAVASPTSPAPSPSGTPAPVRLVLYWGDGCPRCEAEQKFLDELQEQHPTLVVERYEVWKNADNRKRFEAEAERRGVTAQAVPTTFLGARTWVGFTDSIGKSIRAAVERGLAGGDTGSGVTGSGDEGTCDVSEGCTVPPPGSTEADTAVDVPLLGSVDVGHQSLVLSTLLIGFLDGFNPCSLWAISILLAVVLRTGSRRRVLAVGSTFLVVTAGLYAVYMAGIYTALTFIAVMTWVRLGIAGIAGVFGVVNIKDYFWYRRGVSLSIPESSKPGIYKRVRDIARGASLPATLAATVALAVGVSLLETPCTAGFPVLWTSLLAANNVPLGESALLFVVYMVPFLIDELVVFAAAVVTMRVAKVQERHGRLLKLIGGTVMLSLAVVMVVDYELMNSITGATLVFATAILVAALVHRTVGQRLGLRGRPSEPLTRVGS